MERKSDTVRRLVAEGDFKGALKIAKGFRLGITNEQHDDMTRAFECMTSPRFYQSIGYNIDQTVRKGVATVTSLYGA